MAIRPQGICLRLPGWTDFQESEHQHPVARVRVRRGAFQGPEEPPGACLGDRVRTRRGHARAQHVASGAGARQPRRVYVAARGIRSVTVTPRTQAVAQLSELRRSAVAPDRGAYLG